MMSDPRRRWSPESSRRRRRIRRDSREQSIVEDVGAEESAMSGAPSYYPRHSQTYQPASSVSHHQHDHDHHQHAPGPDSVPPMPMSIPMPVPADLNRPCRSRSRDRDRDRRHRRRGSGSSSELTYSTSPGSSSSSSYLDISRWYPSFGRSGGVLKAFFKTPSEHRPRRRRSVRKQQQVRTKKSRSSLGLGAGTGVFGFGNNSSSSSVNSDMAYGMGFIKKPKSRGGGRSPNMAAAAASSTRRDTSDLGRPPPPQRRQTDEEIMEIGRKLAEVAKKQNREDMRHGTSRRQSSQFGSIAGGIAGGVAGGIAMSTWDKYHRQSSGGMESSSRGLAPSRHERRHRGSSSDDESEWESASEDEDSDEASALAYGHAGFHTPRPAKSAVSRMSRMSTESGSGIAGPRVSEDARSRGRNSSVVDPQLFGPHNSLHDFVSTPCGFDDGMRAYTIPGAEEHRHVRSAESATFEARPMQMVYPIQTSDPAQVEAARGSGSIVSSQPNRSSVPLSRVYSTASAADRPDPLPIQAPKPIAPVPSRMYEEEHLHDPEPSPSERREPRRNPSDSKIFAETALVGAGVAALSAAMLARRDKGKGKEPEHERGRDEKYGHEDHREEDTKVLDARKAKELALEREIERLERALAARNKAREQRRRESKRLSNSQPEERSEVGQENDDEGHRDYAREQENRRQERDDKFGTGEESVSPKSIRRPSSSRVSEPRDRHMDVEEDAQRRRVDNSSNTEPTDINVFNFQDQENASGSGSGNTLQRAPSPIIIDVTPGPSPEPEEDRKSRRDSFEDETRDARRVYEEASHSTAPISAVAMAAAIAATEHSRKHHEEDWRGRSGSRTPEEIQEEADRAYRAGRVARSHSTDSRDSSVVDKYEDKVKRQQPRIVTPPGMAKPDKSKYSEPDADVTFDNTMSPTELLEYWPKEPFVLDPSAQRPRPVLNLVMPTPSPTPSPEKQEKKSAPKDPKPAEEASRHEAPSVVINPRDEVVEVTEPPITEPPATPKSVSWGPSETKQYEVESRDTSQERPAYASDKSKSPGKKSSGFGWGTIAAAITGAGVGAALAKDDDSEPSSRGEAARDAVDERRSSGSRSPPKERPILPAGISSQIPEEEPEELPPVPGPKPSSPRNSQMPGAFGEDLDFTATLAAGLEHSGFDPEIVIEDPEYRRRDSPPGTNEPLTGVYSQPFAETASDLGIYSMPDESRSGHTPGYVIGEVDTPASEKAAPFDDPEDASRRQSKRSSSGYESMEAVDDTEKPEGKTSKLSKKEQRKLEKAAKASKLAAQQQEEAVQPIQAGEDEWADAPSSKKSKKSKKSKRSSVTWDDAEAPVNDSRVSVPVNAFDDIRGETGADPWDVPQSSKKSERDSKGYDLPSEDLPDDRDDRRDPYEPIERDAASVVSDSRYDSRSNGHGREDDRSVVSAPPESNGSTDSKPDKRSSSGSGGFWGMLTGSANGDEKKDSKKDNAGTLGAGAGLAGAAVAIAALARSNAAEAPSEAEESHVVEQDVDVPHPPADSPSREIDVLEDPEIAPRVIKPAIDPQYGDLLPLPPSPSENAWVELVKNEEELPSLPDSRPATPPGQDRALLRERERENSHKRPLHTSHSRRTSSYEMPLRSPSHTAIPIQFRMSQHRASPAAAGASRSSPVIGVRTPPTAHNSPDDSAAEFSPTFSKRQPPSRPTSWDSSREIKPLYLLEQAGRSGRGADDNAHDDVAESTPLPPSRESPAPEGEVDYVEAAPLFVDTAIARSAPLGSQESTPRVLPQTEQEVSIPPGDDAEALHGFPSSSSLSESNYATPAGSPSRDTEILPSAEFESKESEITSSPRLGAESEPSRDPIQETSDGKKKKSYFPSSMSMLPAATLAGVGVLLGRGKSDDQSEADPAGEKDVAEPLSRSVDGTNEASLSPRIKADGVELSSTRPSAERDVPQLLAGVSEDTGAADVPVPTSPDNVEVDVPKTSLGTEAGNIDAPATAVVDVNEWALPSASKKKKKKGKGKNKSVSETLQLPTTPAGTSVLDSSEAERDAPSQDATTLEALEKPIAAFEAGDAALSETQPPVHGDIEDPHATSAEQTTTPIPIGVVEPPGEGLSERAGSVELDQRDVEKDSAPSQLEVTDATISLPQLEVASEDRPRATEVVEEPTAIVEEPRSTVETPASIVEEPRSVVEGPVSAVEESASSMPGTDQELGRDLTEVVDKPIDSEAPAAENLPSEATNALAEGSLQPSQPVEDDLAPSTSKKGKKNKKNKKKQSISLPMDVVEGSVPTSSDDKSVLDAQDSSPSRDLADVAEQPQEPGALQSAAERALEEPLETNTTEPLNAESALGDQLGQTHIDATSLAQEPALASSNNLDLEDLPKKTPTQQSPILQAKQIDEPETIVSKPLDEELSLALPEQSEQEQRDLLEEPTPAEPTPEETDSKEPTPAESTTVLAEEEFPVFSKKSKKNKKKRKGSAVLEESVTPSETTKAEESDPVEPPGDAPQQPDLSISRDQEPEVLSSKSKDVIPTPDDDQLEAAQPGDTKPREIRETDHRSPSPVTESVEPLSLKEEPPIPLQDTRLESLPLPSTEVSEAPRQDLGIVGFESTQQEVNSPELGTEHADLSGDKSIEPQDDTQVVHSPLEHIVAPAQDELPVNIATTDPEQTSAELVKQAEDTAGQEEAERREAEATQIQEEEAELARIQLKRKPSKKDKQRLKDLKARAEKRAEEAEVAATSSAPTQADESGSLESEGTIQPSAPTHNEEKDMPISSVEDPGSVGQGDENNAHVEAQQPSPEAEVLEQAGAANVDVEALPPVDENNPEDPQPQSQEAGDPEEVARREAEVALIQEEETELARLKIKRKPSKKDKDRIRSLKANAERREQEAEAAAQRKMEEQTADNQAQEDSTPAQPDAEENVQSLVENAHRHVPEETSSRDVEESSRPPIDLSAQPCSDEPATIIGSTEQTQVEGPIHDRPATLIGGDVDAPRSAEDAVTTLPEQDSDQHREDLTRDNAEVQTVKDSADAIVDASLLPDEQGEAHDQEPVLREVQDGGNQEEILQPLDLDQHSPQDQSSQPREDSPAPEILGTSSPPVQETVPLSEEAVHDQGKDVATDATALEPQQPLATEAQHEPDWFVSTKKSKKDKKKKRKGTISSESGQNSGLVTPLEVSEPAIPVQKEETSETKPSAPQEEISTSMDRENEALGPTEEALPEQDSSTAIPSQSGTTAEEEHSPVIAPDEPLVGTQKSAMDRSMEAQGQTPTSDIAEDPTVGASQLSEPKASGEPSIEPEIIEPSSDFLDSTAVAPPTQAEEPAEEPAKGPERIASAQDLNDLIHTADSRPHQSSRVDESLPVDNSQDATLPDKEVDRAIEATEGPPLETDPGVSSVSEQQPQQPDEEEFAWAPSKKSKKDKKKKKRAGTLSTEPSSGIQTPVAADVAETGSRDIPETSTATEAEPAAQPLAQDVPVMSSEQQEQIDDWDAAPSKKGKKGKKKKNRSSVSSWEPDSSTQTPSTGEQMMPADVAKDVAVISGPAGEEDIATQTVEESQPLQERVVSHTPDSPAKQDADIPPAEEDAPDPVARHVSIDEPVSKSNLDNINQHEDDTLLVAGGEVLDDSHYLPGGHATSPEPNPQRAVEDDQLGDSITKHDLVDKVIDGEDTLTAAGEKVAHETDPVPSEKVTENFQRSASPQPLDLENVLPAEPVTKPELENAIEDEDDTLIVAGGRVSDEVTEPWAFQATHSSEVVPKSDLEARVDDGHDTVIMAGGSIPEQTAQLSHSQVNSPDTAEPERDFLEVERVAERPRSPVPWEDEDRPVSPQRDSDFLSVDQPAVRPESPVPWEDNEQMEVFATPSEQRPDLIDEPQPISSPSPVQATSDHPEAILAENERSMEQPSWEVFKTPSEQRPDLIDEHQSILDSTSIQAADGPAGVVPVEHERSLHEPVAEEPAVEEPLKDEPLKDEPLKDEPLKDEPLKDEPLKDEPPKDEPLKDEPAVDEPAVDEPAVEEPLKEEPLKEEPLKDEPAVDEPAVEEPAVEEPAVEEPLKDEPAVDEPVVDEPAVEDFNAWAPKKLTKKEKRKAKKNSMSKSEPEAVTIPAEGSGTLPLADSNRPGSHDRAPLDLGGFTAQTTDRALAETYVPGTEDAVVEPLDKPDEPLGLGSPLAHKPEPLSEEHSGEAVVPTKPEGIETSVEGSPDQDPSMADIATAETSPPLSRKMSKKEKRKAKKQSTSSWEDDAFETSPAAEDHPVEDVSARAAEPEVDQEKAADNTADTFPTQSSPTDKIPELWDTTTKSEAVAEDEWAMPLSRKKSKKDKKKKGKLSEPASGAQTPLAEEPLAPIEPEYTDLSSHELVHQQNLEQEASDYTSVPESPVRVSHAESAETLRPAQLDPYSQAHQSAELQRTRSKAPSPDIWDNEDYFKPKSPKATDIDPPEEPFDKVEIHPAFTRELNASPDKCNKDDRPLVGLGLIHRHSSIFQEDERHTPKLLTMTSDNFSVESVAVEDMGPSEVSSHPGALPFAEGASGSSNSNTEGARSATLQIQDSAQPTNAALARDFTASNLDESRPKSPYLPRRSHDESPESSTLDDAKHMTRTGSVALLAERFGGSKKSSGMSSPSTAPGRETGSSGDNVSATHSPTGQDAGRFTRQVPEHAGREEEVPLDSLVLESPVLGSQASFEMTVDEPLNAIESPETALDVDTSQTVDQSLGNADTTLDEPGQGLLGLPTPRSASPNSDRGASLEESAMPASETDLVTMQPDFMPAMDFGRPMSRGLAPVQEEPQEEEAESGKHMTTLSATTYDVNRDSGYVAGSPVPSWTRRFDETQLRDSGVHLREYPATSPRLHGSRGVSPDPNRSSRSSLDDEGARLDDKPRRSPRTESETRRRLGDETPVLEAQEPPVTPEPQKSKSGRSRSRKVYPDLGPGATKAAAAAAVLAGGAALLSTPGSPSASSSPAADQRSTSDKTADKRRASASPPNTPPSQKRTVSNTGISRDRTPEPLKLRPESPSLLRHSGTPPLRSRRTRSGDLRSLSQSSLQSRSDLGATGNPSPSIDDPSPATAVKTPASAPAAVPAPASSSSSSDLRRATTPASAAQPSRKSPVANEGRVRTKDMADVYDGFGEGRLGSPRSPTRPHSMRRRQSMQVLELESRVEQLIAENRALAEARSQAEHDNNNRATSALAERDNEIENLKQNLDFMRKEIQRLTEVNEGLNSAIAQSAVQHEDRYRLLETQHADVARELDGFRGRHGSHQEILEEKDAEIRHLREQLEATKEQIREMQRQILATKPVDSDFLQIKDVDYFDHRCQALCSHVQQWVLRFSKFSDMRACRLTSELNDDKIIDRLDNAILDGSNVDNYLNDRVRRRDVFMSLTMTMIWEFVFTRYLFGMDREQRQKLKALEKLLLEVGPPQAVRQWRAVTLTLLSRRDSFKDQRDQDTEAVVQAVFQTLSMILPPPSNLEDQIQNQLRKVMREAVELSVEMRTQRAEYMMLPPLQPDYDANGDLAEPHPFNAQLMSERSANKSVDGDDLQAEGAIVRVVLFPLVVKKGDDAGLGDDEVVVCPAQVIVAKPRSSSRRSMRAPSSDAGGVSLLRGGSPSTAPNRSNVSMQEAEYFEGGI